MPLDTFMVMANQYDTEADALADFEAVRRVYTDMGIIDTYDAAVLTRRADGKVEIVKRVEEPTRHGAKRGLAVGLAVGAVMALLPAVGLAAGLLAGGATGAGAGAIAGHVTGGMKKSDLEALGKLLQAGTSGLVVVAASDVEAKVDAAVTRAKKRAKAQLQADTKAMIRSIEEAAD
jgi:uncharacterized membrane protein